MQTGTEDDGIEQVDGENSVNRRTFVQGVGMLPLSTSLLDNEEARQQLDLGNSAHGSGRTRRFTIHAIEVDIVYNRFGLHQPNGVMYVLDENLDAVRGVRRNTRRRLLAGRKRDSERGTAWQSERRRRRGRHLAHRAAGHSGERRRHDPDQVRQSPRPAGVNPPDRPAVQRPDIRRYGRRAQPRHDCKTGERSSTAGRPHTGTHFFTTGRIRRSTVPTSRQRRRTCYPGTVRGYRGRTAGSDVERP